MLSTVKTPDLQTSALDSLPGFGLYIHWPFCAAKCPYCDFNSHVVSTVDFDRWGRAFEAEISRVGKDTGDRVLNTVFFGGGTPSLMPAELVARILSNVRQTWRTANDLEVTLEANPTSVEARRFKGFVDAGVNRFSIGVQALDDPSLKRLGRLHSASEALNAIEVARSLVDRVSFDLIYARQDQTTRAWARELKEALALEPTHLSLYQLSIEDGTAFGARHAVGKLRGLPDAELSADMYEATQEICENAGLRAYEVSNHAQPEQESRHNLIYWRAGDYLGIGPGAHGRLSNGHTRRATVAERAPTRWLHGVESGRAAHEESQLINRDEQTAEYIMMALRLSEGLSLHRYAAISGNTLCEKTISLLVEDGLLWSVPDRIGTTARGRLVLNAIIRELI